MSTLHANSPADAVERMAVLLSQKLGAASDFGYAQIGQHIDFVVQLSNHLDGNRTLKRFVSEIAELVPGETKRPLAQQIFKAPVGSDVSRAVGRPQEETLADLQSAGFDVNWLLPDGSVE
jgi:pilus assembly protein CpaF